jgi:hypothetical protein
MTEVAVRATPFDLMFRSLADARFPAIRRALEEKGIAPVDRGAFLLVRPVVELLRDLRPGEGLGDAVQHLAALVHHAYLYWLRGETVIPVEGEAWIRLMDPEPVVWGEPPPGSRVYYVQYPARRLWGSPLPQSPPEPLDGCFVARAGDRLAATAIFGVHPDRAAFTVVEVAGPRPSALARADGTPLFAPILPGAAAAGLHAVTDMEELLELAWRSDVLVGDRVRESR